MWSSPMFIITPKFHFGKELVSGEGGVSSLSEACLDLPQSPRAAFLWDLGSAAVQQIQDVSRKLSTETKAAVMGLDNTWS